MNDDDNTGNQVHEIVAPNGEFVYTATTRTAALEWMEANASTLKARERFLIQSTKAWVYRPKTMRTARVPKAEREATRAAKAQERARRASEREAAKAAVEARRAARAQEKEARAALKATEKAKRDAEREAAQQYRTVVTASGAKISVRRSNATTAQLQALVRARATVADEKQAAKASAKAGKTQ